MRAYQPAPSDAERQRRQDEMRERAVAADREPAELHREDVEQQDADDELRRRDADEGGDHQRLVGRACRACTRRDRCPCVRPIDQLADDGAGHQQQRRRQPRRDQLGDLGPLQVGAAEIALQQAGRGSASTARRSGRSRPSWSADVLDRLAAWRCARRSAAPDRPAAGRADEGDERDAEQDQHRLHAAAGRDRPPSVAAPSASDRGCRAARRRRG